MSEPKNEVIKQYEDACVHNGDVLAGHMAINPSGHLVRLPPGSVSVAASMSGPAIDGLKPGWRLASKADISAKEKSAKEADAKDKK